MTDEGSARRRWLVPGLLALIGVGVAVAVVRQSRSEAARDPWLDPIPDSGPRPPLPAATASSVAASSAAASSAAAPSAEPEPAEPEPVEPEPVEAGRTGATDAEATPKGAGVADPDADPRDGEDATGAAPDIERALGTADPSGRPAPSTTEQSDGGYGLLGFAEQPSAESPPTDAADRTQAAADATEATADQATPGVRMRDQEPVSLFEPAPGTPAAAAPTPDLTPAEHPAEAIADSPYGSGSALPLEDGGAPSPAYTIKGNAGSMLFHPPSSPYYSRTRAEVWFTTPEAAEAAGFSPYRARRRENS